MAILVNGQTKVVVQGITGRDGSFHTGQMLDYGTNVVAGVRPGGGLAVSGVPVFNTVAEALAATGANTSVIFVRHPFAPDAIYEAIDAGVALIVCITEGISVLEMSKIYNYLKTTNSRLIGPNCPGVITPGVAKVGIMPGAIHKPGRVGVISRSGTLTYEAVYHLTRAGIGQSTCIGIGGDPIIGTSFVDALALFQEDPDTDAVVLIGEIGGTDEEQAAHFVAEKMDKPVVGFIAGRTAPPGKRMGHAGAIVSGGRGTAQEKIDALEAAGIPVAQRPNDLAELLKARLPS